MSKENTRQKPNAKEKPQHTLKEKRPKVSPSR